MPLADIFLVDELQGGAAPVYDNDPGVPVYYWNLGRVHKQVSRRFWAPLQEGPLDADSIVVALLRAVVQDQEASASLHLPFTSVVRHPSTPNLIPQACNFVHSDMPLNRFYLVQSPEFLGRRVLSWSGAAFFIFNPDAVRAVDADLALVYSVLDA